MNAVGYAIPSYKVSGKQKKDFKNIKMSLKPLRTQVA